MKEEIFKLVQGGAGYLFSMALLYGYGNNVFAPTTVLFVAIFTTAVCFTAFGVTGHRAWLLYASRRRIG